MTRSGACVTATEIALAAYRDRQLLGVPEAGWNLMTVRQARREDADIATMLWAFRTEFDTWARRHGVGAPFRCHAGPR